MYTIFSYNIWTILTAALLVLSVRAFIVYRFRQRRQVKALNRDITDLLKDAQRVSRTQYTGAFQYLLSFSKSKGNDTGGFLSSLSLPQCISRPASFLTGDIIAVKNQGNSKTGGKLFRLRDEIWYQFNSLQEYVQHYKDEVKLNESSYLENIVELSKMHDELGRYMNNKNFDKSNGSEWYEGYFAIFGAWFQNGADKDTETTYNEIVLKIIALNKLYRFIPFVIQTTTCSLNCVTAYNNIVTLNKLLKEKILQYAYYYKFSYKTLRLILQKKASSPKRQIIKMPAIAAPIQPDEAINQAVSEHKNHAMAPVVTDAGKPNYLLYGWLAGVLVAMLVIFYFLYPSVWHKQPEVQKKVGIHAPSADTALSDTKPSAIHITAIDSLNNIADFKILFDSGARSRPFVYGIDISKYQGKLIEDLESLDTLHFIICKATEGSVIIDPDFDTNWTFIKKKGLIRGAYHFFHSDDSPIQQAQLFLQTIQELRNTDIPPIVDVEEGSLKDNATPAQLNTSLVAFLKYVQERTKRKPVIYSDVYFANRFLLDSSLADYPLWLADYTNKSVPAVPSLWKNKGYIIWQRSSSYNIGTRKTDFDIFNGNGEAFAKFIRSN